MNVEGRPSSSPNQVCSPADFRIALLAGKGDGAFFLQKFQDHVSVMGDPRTCKDLGFRMFRTLMLIHDAQDAADLFEKRGDVATATEFFAHAKTYKDMAYSVRSAPNIKDVTRLPQQVAA